MTTKRATKKKPRGKITKKIVGRKEVAKKPAQHKKVKPKSKKIGMSKHKRPHDDRKVTSWLRGRKSLGAPIKLSLHTPDLVGV